MPGDIFTYQQKKFIEDSYTIEDYYTPIISVPMTLDRIDIDFGNNSLSKESKLILEFFKENSFMYIVTYKYEYSNQYTLGSETSDMHNLLKTSNYELIRKMYIFLSLFLRSLELNKIDIPLKLDFQSGMAMNEIFWLQWDYGFCLCFDFYESMISKANIAELFPYCSRVRK